MAYLLQFPFRLHLSMLQLLRMVMVVVVVVVIITAKPRCVRVM